MEIITDASGKVKVGGVILPGIFQNIEVDGDVRIDEAEVEGKSAKPKQAVGYEDAKVKLNIVLINDEESTPYEKLKKLQNIFKRPGQQLPYVYEIVNRHLQARGITKIIFKKLSSSEDNNLDLIRATCEFWEYVPITIQAQKNTGVGSGTAPQLTKEYQEYLNQRNSKIGIGHGNKTSRTAAVDDDKP